MKTNVFAREAQISDFIARYLWSGLRLLFKAKLVKRCRQCAISERLAELNAEGICKHCEKPSSSNPDLPSDLDNFQLLDKYLPKEISSQYDALIMLSGGKDSAFLAHKLIQRYPHKKFQAVLVNNGFMSPYALENASKTCAKLNLDLKLIQVNRLFAIENFRFAFLNIAKQTKYSLVDTMDGHMTFDMTRTYAKEIGVRTIICGIGHEQALNVFGESVTELSHELQWRYFDSLNLKRKEIQIDEEYSRWHKTSNSDAEPKIILPMVVWHPSEEEILNYVKKHNLTTKKLSPLLTNNRLIPVIGLAENWIFGYSCWEEEFCSQIRDGLFDFTYWRNLFEMLDLASSSDQFLNNTMKSVLEELDLSKLDIVGDK